MNRRAFITAASGLFVPAAFAIPPALKKSIVLAPIPRPVVAAGGGTGGNAWTHVQDNSASSAYTVTLTGVTAGNLLVAFFKWEDYGTATSATDGAAAMTLGTQINHDNTYLRGCFAYTLSATSGTRAMAVTIGGGTPSGGRCIAMEFSATGTHAYVSQNSGSNTNTAIASGTFSTDTDNSLVVGAYGEYTGNAISSPLCNSQAATAMYPGTPYAQMWYKSLTGIMTNGTVSATLAPSGEWICCGMAFKST
jgi:hypothetical protein